MSYYHVCQLWAGTSYVDLISNFGRDLDGEETRVRNYSVCIGV